ncbi:unnamed protein product [Rhizophagus irregularis]|uniref:Uncharacterized protein n=1 Tax=Rhizophagus irregularis TaxID=588596 RepID=A0A2I1F571_9GLOM|nr:hypothetical protein RhiirB3_446159 [Rhizophagus irregularis]CAB4490539.1 unnamed protein product [Rhizophagus irregularis]CAB5372015.1 unnamed protein product [Rhizophagus irregularis]
MMQNSSTEYPEYSGYHPFEVANDFNDPPYENTLLTHPPLTQRNVSQQNNNFSMHQNLQIFSNSFNAFEENINRQLNELKRLLNQIRQFIIAQQQSPQQTSMPRRIYRNHAPRPHPYLNERPLVSSRTPTIRYAAPAYRHTTEQLSSPDALHRQQTNVPAETTDNEIYSPDIQDYEFWENS